MDRTRTDLDGPRASGRRTKPMVLPHVPDRAGQQKNWGGAPMSFLPKSSVIHAFQLALFDHELPENYLYPKARRAISDKDYMLEALVISGGHALRFEMRDTIAVEYVTEFDRIVPSAGLITCFPCPQERDFEHRFVPHATPPMQPSPGIHPSSPHHAKLAKPLGPSAGVVYMTSVQTETLPESLYASTCRELIDFGRQNGALVHLWRDAKGPCLSMIDMQRYSGQAHAQTYHLTASGGVVLRTQSIFELA